MARKRTLITGITGQDGSYLAELLLGKGYEVHGIIRRSSLFKTDRIDHLYQDPHQSDVRLFLHHGDATDTSSLNRILEKTRPHEIYHLAAQSHVKVSFEVPEYTAEVNAIGTLRILDAIKESGIKSRFYQASTSELYGNTPTEKQNEESPFCPRSPYAAAKLYAYWTVVNYREAYNLHASNGILFNHESPRRGGTFVTKKITMGLANILAKKQEKIYLGNLSAKRDWGYAPDYVEAMWMMLQQEKPDDYVIATGESHSVKEFAEKAFALAGMNLVWKGSGNQEKGIDKKTNRTLIEIDPYYYRPTDVDELVGDAKKARKKLGWKPKVSFDELVKIMVHADCEKAGIRLK